MKEATIYTRRNFLKTSILGSASMWTIPVFLENTINCLASQTLTPITTHDGTILVLIQLAGGNDGLNTIIPFKDDLYFKARPSIAIKSKNYLNINDHLQFNPTMKGFKNIYDDGNLAIIQGVGYPNPNRSHFTSTDIWQQGGKDFRSTDTGWIGRYFDSNCSGSDPFGVSITEKNPLAFKGKKTNSVLSFTNPNEIHFNADSETMNESLQFFKEINKPQLNKINEEPPVAEFLERTALDAVVSLDKIKKTFSHSITNNNYPNTKLGKELQYIANMINGEFSTQVYYASQTGYDTHGNQLNKHDNLLKELSGAIEAFVADLKQHNNFNRVVIMTFSEFGRRVHENGDVGTDHGAAAPMFVIGGKIKPGIYGSHPSLQDLDDGDLKYNIDFRSVYATILNRWLNVDQKNILGNNFTLIDFL